MLEEISIKNFAIIEELTVSFENGLTVLSGETGAGKSIIIDAIGLLIGGRGSAEYVRHGEKRAEMEGLFRLEDNHPAVEKLEDAGIDIEDDMVVLRRDITHQGKSICRINGKLVTLAVLRETGHSLVDIHGQHEHQDLMHAERHQQMLDRFGKTELEEALEDYQKRYYRFGQLQSKLKQLKESDQETANRLDFIQYQLQEIEAAGLQPGEDEDLEKERHILANSEKLFEAIRGAYDHLYGEGKALDWAGMAVSNVEEATEIDTDLRELSESISSAYYMMEEATFTLRDKADSMAFDPERLNEVENRLDELNKLKRKYGDSVEEILVYASKIEEEIDSLANKEERIAEYEQALSQAAEELIAEAKTLTDLRRQAGQSLAGSVQRELQALYMEKATMEVQISPLSRGKTYQTPEGETWVFNEKGADKIEFLISANAGEPLKPLAKVASGGEISRIMLALKTILSGFQHVTSLIFDEVDTGVSGRVAQAIAEKIHLVSRGSQVLCITHLPQVAAMADSHLYIQKEEKEERVQTIVTPLTADYKIDEIARMISGVEVTALTRENATELLEMAEKAKSNV